MLLPFQGVLFTTLPWAGCWIVLLLLSNQQDDDFQRHIEEDNLWIGILGDESLALFKEVGDVDDVRLIDEAGEILGKVFLFLRHIDQLRLAEVVHETLAKHVHEVIEHSLLL